MVKITFMGAGSTVFAKNVLGDCLCSPALNEAEIALYDIDAERLKDSEMMLSTINHNSNNDRATIKSYLGVENRKEALRNANFVVNAIQVGLYDPCTIIDFEVPKKFGLRQTIADTLGIGGIMRALRTIPVLDDFARDMQEVCPGAWFLNYTNPMAMLSGFMQRYAGIKTIGLCHSVQSCSEGLLRGLGMDPGKEHRPPSGTFRRGCGLLCQRGRGQRQQRHQRLYAGLSQRPGDRPAAHTDHRQPRADVRIRGPGRAGHQYAQRARPGGGQRPALRPCAPVPARRGRRVLRNRLPRLDCAAHGGAHRAGFGRGPLEAGAREPSARLKAVLSTS